MLTYAGWAHTMMYTHFCCCCCCILFRFPILNNFFLFFSPFCFIRHLLTCPLCVFIPNIKAYSSYSSCAAHSFTLIYSFALFVCRHFSSVSVVCWLILLFLSHSILLSFSCAASLTHSLIHSLNLSFFRFLLYAVRSCSCCCCCCCGCSCCCWNYLVARSVCFKLSRAHARTQTLIHPHSRVSSIYYTDFHCAHVFVSSLSWYRQRHR